MSDFVLDCSMAMTWCFVDEQTPATLHVLRSLAEHRAIVPSLWHLEVANTLSIALRKGRATNDDRVTFLRLVDELPIIIDDQTAFRALNDTLMLSQKFEITAYDAAYLELAQRLDLPLASKDKELCRAARKLKIALIEA